ncbi:MAG TPA: hypothetical protein VGA89_02160 [Patescibacteria group bacterium]|jgi:hypothetical protein
MKKETITAILIGLSLGLFITYGVYQARTGISRRSNEPQLAITNQTDDSTGELVLNSPLDESVQEENTISVSGTTIVNSFVIVFVGNEETITHSDDSGNFSVEVELEEGANIITVVVIDEDGRSLSTERTLVVTDETFTTETATNSGENQEEN